MELFYRMPDNKWFGVQVRHSHEKGRDGDQETYINAGGKDKIFAIRWGVIDIFDKEN